MKLYDIIILTEKNNIIIKKKNKQELINEILSKK